MILFTANFTTLLTIFGGLILLLSLCCLFTTIYKRLARRRGRGKRRHLFTPQSEMIHLEWQLQQQLSTASQAPMPLPIAFTVVEKDQKDTIFETDLEMAAPTPLKTVHIVNDFYPHSTAQVERKVPTPASSVHSMISHRPASSISHIEEVKNGLERPASRAMSIATADTADAAAAVADQTISSDAQAAQAKGTQSSGSFRVEPVTQAPAAVSLPKHLASRSPFLPLRASPNMLNATPSPFSSSPSPSLSLSALSPTVDRRLSYCHSSASESNLCSSSGPTHAPLPCRLSPILSLDDTWNNNRAPWEAQVEKEYSSPELHTSRPELAPPASTSMSKDSDSSIASTTVSSASAWQQPTPSSLPSSNNHNASVAPSDMLIIKPFEVITI